MNLIHMHLIITRHGETIESVNGICMGQTPGTLSPTGVKQAKKLALRLKNRKFDVIYSSDLKRTFDTTNEILKFHPSKKINLDVRLREAFMGKLQGNKFPKDWDWNNRPSDVESHESICLRVRSFIEDIYSKHKHESVLVSCHGGTIMAFLTILNNKPISEFESWDYIENTSITEFDIEDDENNKMHLFNCTQHLIK